jgi:hypothetical protein
MLGIDQVQRIESWFKNLAMQANDRAEGAAFAVVLKLEDIREEARGTRITLSVIALLLLALIGLLWWKL